MYAGSLKKGSRVRVVFTPDPSTPGTSAIWHYFTARANPPEPEFSLVAPAASYDQEFAVPLNGLSFILNVDMPDDGSTGSLQVFDGTNNVGPITITGDVQWVFSVE